MPSLRRVAINKDVERVWARANRNFYRRHKIDRYAGRRWFVSYIRAGSTRLRDSYACMRLCAARGDPFARRNLATLIQTRLELSW